MNKLIASLNNAWKFLQGKKIHLSMVIASAVILADYFKLINSDQYYVLMKLDAAFFGIGFRSFAQKIVDSLNEFSANAVSDVPVLTTGTSNTQINISSSGTETPMVFSKNAPLNEGEIGPTGI